MSTLTISPAFAPGGRRTSRPARTGVRAVSTGSATRPVRRSATRLTRRGRAVLVLGFLVLALVAMTVLGGFATATHESGTPVPVRVVQVQPGDTLYGIAGELAEPGHVREMVTRIQRLNSMSGSSLQVGDQLAVPRS